MWNSGLTGNGYADVSVSPEPTKKETMKNSEINAKARNEPIVISPFWVVQPLKVELSPFSLDAITSYLNCDVCSTLASFIVT